MAGEQEHRLIPNNYEPGVTDGAPGFRWERPSQFPPLPEAAIPGIEISAMPRIELRSSLDQALEAYRTRPHTRELITEFHGALWRQIGAIAGVNIAVPVFESQKDIKEQEGRGKGIIFVPEGHAAQNQRLRIVSALSKIVGNEFVPNNWSVQDDNSVTNDVLHTGYRWVDMAINAPHANTSDQSAGDLMKKSKPEEGADGMNLSEYVIAGLQSKLVTGKYLDEVKTWVRLLESRHEDFIVYTKFNPDGRLHVRSSFGPLYLYRGLGVRFSSGMKSF